MGAWINQLPVRHFRGEVTSRTTLLQCPLCHVPLLLIPIYARHASRFSSSPLPPFVMVSRGSSAAFLGIQPLHYHYSLEGEAAFPCVKRSRPLHLKVKGSGAALPGIMRPGSIAESVLLLDLSLNRA